MAYSPERSGEVGTKLTGFQLGEGEGAEKEREGEGERERERETEKERGMGRKEVLSL